MKYITKIIKESLVVLIFAAILSSLGGVGLKYSEEKILFFLPLMILLPALNGLVGDFGIVMVSRFTTLVYKKNFTKRLEKAKLRHISRDLFIVGIIMSFYISLLSGFISKISGFDFHLIFLIKLILIVLATVFFMIFLIFFISYFGIFYSYKRNIDPDDLLIPLTTSIADFGTMIVFSVLVILFF